MDANTSPAVARFTLTMSNAQIKNTVTTTTYMPKRSVDSDAERLPEEPSGAEVLELRPLPHELLDQQCEPEGQQREVEVADPEARQRDREPERHRDERTEEDREPDRHADVPDVGGVGQASRRRTRRARRT